MNAALVLNVGSSSLKWSVFDDAGNEVSSGKTESLSPGEPFAKVFERAFRDAPPVRAVGHRFVHGGARFRASVRVDDAVRAALGELVPLDPLHMKPAVEVLDLARARWADAAHVAVFDTAFHATIPEEAARYAIPEPWTLGGTVRRYGFHGLSVDHATGRASAILGRTPDRLVVLHLGSGCSITAVSRGRSVDTTMGFTPLEGLMMGTRSGSIDPGLLLHVMTALGLDPAAAREGLESRSGLLAIAGSADLRAVLRDADGGSAKARLAYAMFVHGIVRYTGAMIGSLGGLDALVFTGGAGENSARLRADAAAAFAFAGVEIDARANEACVPDASIGRGRVPVMVVVAREDLVILREIRAIGL
jgi:acetate kinase